MSRVIWMGVPRRRSHDSVAHAFVPTHFAFHSVMARQNARAARAMQGNDISASCQCVVAMFCMLRVTSCVGVGSRAFVGPVSLGATMWGGDRPRHQSKRHTLVLIHLAFALGRTPSG